MMFFVIISKQEKTFNEVNQILIKKRHFPQRAIEYFFAFIRLRACLPEHSCSDM